MVSGGTSNELLAPARAAVGESVTVTVRNGTNREPVEGATVEGVPGATGADGRLTFGLDLPGVKRLKAQAPGAIRSNGVDLCVEVSGTGSCSGFTSPLAPPLATVRDRAAPQVVCERFDLGQFRHVSSLRSAPRVTTAS